MSETLETKATVTSDSGKKHTVLIYQQWIDAGAHDGGPDKIRGLKRITTTEGLHVNQLDPHTLQIVETNEIIRF